MGLENGAFFESVAYPGAILLLLTLAMLLISAPLRLAVKGPHTIALAAILGLFAWTLLSLLWTPARDIALEDAGRLLIYAASFLAGLILASLLGSPLGRARSPSPSPRSRRAGSASPASGSTTRSPPRSS